MLLSDHELSQLISKTPPLVTGTDPNDIGGLDSKIQPASVDLTIGEIFLPGKKDDELGGASFPRQQIALHQGHTAVIRTREELNIPDSIGAFGSPPSSVSLKGLLMTNPGHIDPGYGGHMHFTVINMGEEAYDLEVGARIVTVIFFDMKSASRVPFKKLAKGKPRASGAINEELLKRLSTDFMNIDKRAKRQALKYVWRLSIVGAVIAAAISVAPKIFEPWREPVNELKTQVQVLDERIKNVSDQKNIEKIRDEVKSIEEKINNM